MKFLEMFESRIDDLVVNLKRTKEQYDRLNKDDDDLHHRRMAAYQQPDDALLDRKKKFSSGIKQNLNTRLVALAHKMAYLRGQIAAEKHKGTLTGVFLKYSSQQTGYQNRYIHQIGQMIDDADEKLAYPAEYAITQFVGHMYSKSPDEGGFGVMQEKRLEDAYSPTPSKEGMLVRQQLTTAFAPIREALRREFGDHVTLHRAQGPVNKTRYTLSYTGTLKVAGMFLTAEREVHTKEIPIDQIIWITDRANQHEFIVRAE